MGGLFSKESSAVGEGAASVACRYYEKDVTATVDAAQSTLGSFEKTSDYAQWCLSCAGTVTSITAAVSTGCKLYQTINSVKQKSRLEELGQQVSGQLKDINFSMDTMVGIDEPRKLAKHIHCFAEQQMELANHDSKVKHLFFVYHPGNNWWPEFDKLPALPEGFCGKSDKVEALAMALKLIRKAVGDEPQFHVLVPSAHVYAITDPLVIPSQLGNISIEGETNGNGPFVYVSMPEQYRPRTRNLGHLNDDSAIPSRLRSSDQTKITADRQDRAAKKTEATSNEPVSAAREAGAVLASIGAGIGGGTGGAVVGAFGGPVGLVTGMVTGGVASGVAAADSVRKGA
jgi:microcompartment protein CcmL/EutN